MLKLLADYARSHPEEIGVESGFRTEYVRWAIELDSQKGFLGVHELGDTSQKNNKGQEFRNCPEIPRSAMQGKIIRCHFLIENAGVISLYTVEQSDTKTPQKHRYFISMLEDAGKTVPQLATIARMLQDDASIKKIQEALKTNKAKQVDKTTVQLDGEFPVKTVLWHDWWRTYRSILNREIASANKSSKRGKGEATKRMRCFVSGDLVEPARTHAPIIGLSGRGDTLICFDKEAFQSYGLEQSANAAVSEEAMSTYRAGLNDLIRKHGYTLAGVRMVHWFKERVEQEADPFQLVLETPEQQEMSAQSLAKKLLESIKTGESASLGKNHYYALTLSGAAGRVMVRDWMEGSFRELAENVKQWFDDMEIVNLDGVRSTNPPGLERVITCLLPPKKPGQKYEDWTKPLGSARLALLHSAIKSRPISHTVCSAIVHENKNYILSGDMEKLLNPKEKDPSKPLLYATLYTRMGIIKTYHLRKQRKEKNTMGETLQPVLNENYPDPAYQCGRLMAVLAELQRAALGDVGAGVVQRYYAAASATPALVLGRLIRTSQFHLNKLENRDERARFEEKIMGISNNLKNGIPVTLTLEAQSLFALGYYQQLADLRVGKPKKSENNNEEEKNNG